MELTGDPLLIFAGGPVTTVGFKWGEYHQPVIFKLLGEYKMSKHQEELLLNDYYTIGVVFSSDVTAKQYTYKVDKSMKVEEEDYVVVLADGQYKIVMVASIHEENQIDFNTNFAYKYIVDVLDFTTYDKLKERSKIISKTLTESNRRKLKSELLENLTDGLDKKTIKKLTASCGNDFLGDK